ncbi:MAG: TetM/TetW/TetO/TetS family tetracycline resistance ribosomal protection protein [Lachnospiraceae bacterium]|nr:TetM/TetW/TetO/TetS family tetracycline resistance ribosomal protection protein [Lachnospiraceae bacterium]
MRRCCIALLAHVDAGKTTLSEAILYKCNVIKNLGRVDKKDSFLDSHTLERSRGITIFSKQAVFEYDETYFSLLDTPGHVDFSAEAERTLPVLDAAILVISGPEGVQAHTRTIWRLLKNASVPVFIFVNKCDREVDRAAVLKSIKENLSNSVADMSGFSANGEERIKVLEDLATCDSQVFDEYLESGLIKDETILKLIAARKVYPLLFGSALRLEGIDELLSLLSRFTPGVPDQKDASFSAKIFKIGRDKTGNRMTYMKITSGVLKTRDEISYRPAIYDPGSSEGEETAQGILTEKITQLRVYSSDKYESIDKAEPGMIVAVLGLTGTYAGQLLGGETDRYIPELIPVMEYRVVEKDRIRLLSILKNLKILEEEEPSLECHWDDELKELRIRIMGDIQLEIIKYQMKERFGMDVEFDTGSVLYKETVKAPVIGVGHFEPLRHYAEVQLLIEPGERGSGITVSSLVSTNDLALNWQRLIITHILEKEHKGVLTGAVLTDVSITLVAGRAHLKHTEGGDFRQATYRAVRNGLMRAGCSLLEPYLEFCIIIPLESSGRAMTDIERLYGKISSREDDLQGMVTLKGTAPASTITGYSKEITAYTKGLGSITLSYCGYFPCHDQEEIVSRCGYDPEADLRNPSSSVFCVHGSGFIVPWNEVDAYKHLECAIKTEEDGQISLIIPAEASSGQQDAGLSSGTDEFIGTDEIDAIIERTAFGNRKAGIKNPYKRFKKTGDTGGAKASKNQGNPDSYSGRVKEDKRDKYLLVDGYNIIFSWDELKKLAAANLDGARERLNDILSNYQALTGSELIVVYDAYRVEGHREEYYIRQNIKVVFTKQAETADRYIERFSHENAARFDITVATSDGLEQIIIRGAGCRLMTSQDLYHDINHGNKELSDRYLSGPGSRGALIGELVTLKDPE